MAERPKIAAYRRTLNDLAKAGPKDQKDLEGKAAKLGLEIQGAPRPTPRPAKAG
ncbi:MAG: hypothetical protein J0626_11540 [Rhodospirillaceae bacterium]|nr:hypothetical protein [Rhodospirillaceae bacterium]